MAQITRITSEALQATVRRLLPSQQGFGEDLEASNVITPIIDLTPTAEGSVLPYEMQTALAFGSITAFNITTTGTIVNNTGFFRVFGCCRMQGETAAQATAQLTLSDGSTDKDIWAVGQGTATGQGEFFFESFDFTIFLRAGDSFKATCSNNAALIGNTRQIADVNGNLISPSGFSPQ